MIRWLADGELGQQKAETRSSGGAVRIATVPSTGPSIALIAPGASTSTPALKSEPAAPPPPTPLAPGSTEQTGVWEFQVNNFNTSGNITLAASDDPWIAACEWVKAHYPYGMSLKIDGWNGKGEYWHKQFTFETDAAFWRTDCRTWASTKEKERGLHGLGQAGTVFDWTGVPKPPYWDLTGLPWPPTGQFSPEVPIGYPPGFPWPPPPPPGWPPDWPWPLPVAPAAPAPPPLPPAPKSKTTPAPPGAAPPPQSPAARVGVALLAVAAVTLVAVVVLRGM